MYEVILTKKVEKFLDKLNKENRERITSALERLRVNPESHLERLTGEKTYKFRVGKYRLIIELNKGQLQVIVIDVGHRRNIYK